MLRQKEEIGNPERRIESMEEQMKVYVLLEGSWDWSDYFIQYLGGEDIEHIFLSIEAASEYVSKTYDDTYNKDLTDLSDGKAVTLKEWGKRGDNRYSYLYIKEYKCD